MVLEDSVLENEGSRQPIGGLAICEIEMLGLCERESEKGEGCER
jgi:hypothetical protein